ncbi:hypothetical protein [Cryptosporangium sp. NPDC048952]|uniref:hypothetical protein n=1 Tax=Cryptosporangium sp. NPDC048952 TaxID=3363961 RepID=UPI003714C68D
MGNPGLLREVRALVFVLVCVSLSVALHTWAHGHVPSLVSVLAGAGLVVPLAVVLTGRERGLPVIAAALAVTQAGLHGVFSMGPAHVMAGSPRPGAMIAAHVLAGALTAVWLAAGEAAVWRLVRWLGRRLPSLSALFALVAMRLSAPAPRRFRARLADLAAPPPLPTWARSATRRGPPPAAAS